ncbi:MAG: MFS transporter, partial [Ruthenibacterium lactatiformans]
MNIPAKVRNGIFAILLSSCIVSSMVHTVLNTALFPIMEEFDISAARAQWLITAFSLVMGVMVLATASLIRRFPNRPLYLTFMGLFCLGLLLSAAAPSFSVLLIGRILQALGCGMLLSLTQVVVLSAYPSEAQGRVMGIYGLAVSAAPVLAPTLSGIVIDLFGWHMVFW